MQNSRASIVRNPKDRGKTTHYQRTINVLWRSLIYCFLWDIAAIGRILLLLPYRGLRTIDSLYRDSLHRDSISMIE